MQKVSKASYTIYHEVNSASNYELLDVAYHFNDKIIESIMTDFIRIEDYRGFARANNFNSYLYLRSANNWKNCLKTGLFATHRNNIFYGDILHNQKRHLIILTYFDEFKSLQIDFYNAYPANKDHLHEVIKRY